MQVLVILCWEGRDASVMTSGSVISPDTIFVGNLVIGNVAERAWNIDFTFCIFFVFYCSDEEISRLYLFAVVDDEVRSCGDKTLFVQDNFVDRQHRNDFHASVLPS